MFNNCVENSNLHNLVFKFNKALYSLKQAPSAWYDIFSSHLLKNNFHRGKIDKMLVIKTKVKDILIVQVYVNDILFGAANNSLCKEFSKIMCNEYEMSMMGDLKIFLGLQIKQNKDGIFIVKVNMLEIF